MCGRFHNHVKAMNDWVEVLRDWPGDHALGFNVSPTQSVPIVTAKGTVGARWGLVPPWEKNFSTRYPTHNARLETVADKPSFRQAWSGAQTCLVPVAGFYEWKKAGSQKQPYFIHKPSDMLVFAGLWQSWQQSTSFTILTTASQAAVADLHHRMPVMLGTDNAANWLAGRSVNGESLRCSGVADALTYYPVSTHMNNSNSAGPGCAQRIDLGQEVNPQLGF